MYDQPSAPFWSAHESFEALFTSSARVTVLAAKDYAFAHEAGVYLHQSDEVCFTSNLLVQDSNSRVEISRVHLETGKVTVLSVESVKTGNGGCPYRDGVLMCDQGTQVSPSQLVWFDPANPHETHALLNNFNGRGFNSLNDVITLRHPSGDLVFFTDPPYGHEQGFRPPCQLPPAVYVFDPRRGHVRMVADGFPHPNGIAFSPDGSTCYVTDTSHIHGSGKLDPSLYSTMYVYITCV
jgi:gluconolactonase